MLDRAKFDTAFRAIFFTKPTENNLLTSTIPLPASPGSIDTFLVSQDGKVFAKKLETIVAKLKEWADKRDIPSNNLAGFLQNFVSNDGVLDYNKLLFPLFIQGIPKLAKIVELLYTQQLSDDICTIIIKNLIDGMNVCPPGINTNISDAYYQLLANPADELMAIRRNIVEQLALQVLRKNKPKHFTAHNEIHYVNSISNYYADTLGLVLEEDKTATSNYKSLELQLTDFAANIYAALTVETIIEQVILKLNIAELQKKPNTRSSAY